MGAVLFLFLSVQSFKADAQALPHLPHEVQAPVVSEVVRLGALGELVIQMSITVAGRRTQSIAPFVSVADHCPKVGDCGEIARFIEGGVIINKIIIYITEDAFPIGSLS